MRKACIGIVGILACGAGLLNADGYSQSDKAVIAGKGVFPGDGSNEGTLPEADMTDDADDNATNPDSSNNGQGEKDVTPEVNPNQPKGGKDFFPQTKSPTGQTN